MRIPAIVAAAVLVAAAPVHPQSAKLALVPGAGFMLGYTLVDGQTDTGTEIQFEQGGAPYFSVGAEYVLGKRISLTGSLVRTIGQPDIGEMTLFEGGTQVATANMAVTQVSAGVVIRPMGRLPTGAPTPLFIEGGAGLNWWAYGDVIFRDPPNTEPGTAFKADLFNASANFFYAGAGATFVVGPRAQLSVFGRASFIGAYESDFVTNVNTQSGWSLAGTTGPRFSVGVGLRVGR